MVKTGDRGWGLKTNQALKKVGTEPNVVQNHTNTGKSLDSNKIQINVVHVMHKTLLKRMLAISPRVTL